MLNPLRLLLSTLMMALPMLALNSHVYAAESATRASEFKLDNGLRIGQNVQHAKFGLGVIVTAEGRGEEARVQVNFGAHGMKWLALQYAKLTPV